MLPFGLRSLYLLYRVGVQNNQPIVDLTYESIAENYEVL